MKKITARLKIHTPWYKYQNQNTFDHNKGLRDFLQESHHFNCGEICDIEISNSGLVDFLFKTELNEEQVREYCSIFLYFISICNGYNCEFETTAYIDNVVTANFFTYAKEDKTDFPLLKDIKFYEIGLEDIRMEFGNIIYKLFSANRLFMVSLLSNYYSMVVYKDFIGNGSYRFRNIITNIESLITIVEKNKYINFKEENKNYIKRLSQKTELSCTELKKHISPRIVSLKDKIKDTFLAMQKYGLFFKFDIEEECEKIANTRNFISHLFDEDKKYLSEKEISDYTVVFAEIFRMLFLEYCGVELSLIREKFLKNVPLSLKFKRFFKIVPIM